MLSSESVGFPKESKAHLQKQIQLGQTKIYSQSDLWKLQEYFTYFKDSKGSYGEKDWLFRNEGALKVRQTKRREIVMKNNNQINVPQAREAMDKFKMQAAQEVGVNLTNGYNGHLTSREAGSVGGQMVKHLKPIRTKKFERHNRIAIGHIQTVQYIVKIAAYEVEASR